MRYRWNIILFLIFFLPLSILRETVAEDILDTIAYKLAAMHTAALEPGNVLLKKTKPADSVVSEFKWIMESLKSRCFNSEASIADTVVETWKTATGKGYSLTLLDTARELLKMTRNTNLFGANKVNFKATTKYWLATNLPTFKKSK